MDILVSDDQRELAVNALLRHEFTERRLGDVVSRMIPTRPGLPIVDIMPVDARTFSTMMSESIVVRIEGTTQRVPAIEHLMAMKLHALQHGHEERRHKDALDVLELARVRNMDVLSDEFRALCLKFGGQKAYDFLKKFGGPL